MAETAWTRVFAERDLIEGKPLAAKVGDEEVVVVRAKGKLYACGNKCTHYGRAMSKGIVVGTSLICHAHAARFDLASGKRLAPPGLGDLPSYDVKTDNGEVLVRARERSGGARKAKSGPSVLLIGAGAASDMAAATLREEGFGGRITMVTREKGVPYDRPTLSKELISGEAKPDWLPIRSESFYKDNDIEIASGRLVTGFDPRTKTATLSDGERLSGDLVLLATGSVPRKLAISGSDRPNCHYLRTIEDGEKIVASAERAKRAVVIGASFIGLEVASGLRARNIEVHVAAPEKYPLIAVFGSRIAERIRRLHEENGVIFHLETGPVRFEGGERAERVFLGDGSSLEADFFVIGIGALPSVDYLASAELLVDGAVPVDGRLETKYPGVYAAGDIASVPNHYSGESRRIEHWVVAQRQGMHAAKAMLGSKEPFVEPAFFWTVQFEQSFKYVGDARGHYDLYYRGDVASDSFAAGYYVKGRLAAFAGLKRNRELMVVGEILKAGKTVPADQFERAEDLEPFLN